MQQNFPLVLSLPYAFRIIQITALSTKNSVRVKTHLYEASGISKMKKIIGYVVITLFIETLTYNIQGIYAQRLWNGWLLSFQLGDIKIDRILQSYIYIRMPIIVCLDVRSPLFALVFK